MAKVAKVIEIVGESPNSFQEAVTNAVSEAARTVEGITGVQVKNLTCNVDPQTGRVTEYKADVDLAFGVKENR
ncbi:MAG: dodecin domain-containing protein [Firmicutes bacterium]|nr:dodecin domain-containing protein [Bacillota bacterium]